MIKMEPIRIIRIQNIHKYVLTFENDDLVITHKDADTKKTEVYEIPESVIPELDHMLNFITKEKLSTIDLRHSIIDYIEVRDGDEIISIDQAKYDKVFMDILEYVPRDQLAIIKTSSHIDYIFTEKNDGGYTWYPELQISVKNVNSNKCMSNIIQLVELCGYTIRIIIRTSTTTVYFRI